VPAGNTVCLAFVAAWGFAVVNVLAVSPPGGRPRCKRRQRVQLDLAHVRTTVHMMQSCPVGLRDPPRYLAGPTPSRAERRG
jgi:hypothetical protein